MRALVRSSGRDGGAADGGAASAQSTLRVVMLSDLKILDPIWTTAYIVRDHGYMVYDTLLAMDAKLEVKPQMADSWKVSDDKLTYTFVLRDGLKFHDGQPVTAEDCVASIKRWGARDAMGQKLMQFTRELAVVDARTFTLTLKEPYGMVLESLGKPSLLGAVHHAQAHRRDAAGQAGLRVHRLGPVRLQEGAVAAGREGGLREVRRLQAAARAALGPGRRQDGLSRSRRMGRAARRADRGQRADRRRDRHDAAAAVRHAAAARERARASRSSTSTRSARHFAFRFNTLHKPFDDPRIRVGRALCAQPEGLRWPPASAIRSTRRCARTCSAAARRSSTVEGLGGQAERQFGQVEGDPARRRATTARRSCCCMPPTRRPAWLAPVAKALLERGGFKVEMVSTDWQTVLARRSRKEAPSAGGWSAFTTTLATTDILDPVVSLLRRRGVREGVDRLAVRRQDREAARRLRAHHRSGQAQGTRRGAAGAAVASSRPTRRSASSTCRSRCAPTCRATWKRRPRCSGT